MAVLTLTEIQNLALDRLVANVATDAPISTTELNRAINDSYSELWDEGGSSTTKANHATLWTPSPAVAGTILLTGVIANFKELLAVFLSVTVGSTGAPPDIELDRMELSEMRFRRNSTALYGDTVAYALERPEPATPVITEVGKINLHIWPPALGTQYYPAHYVKTKTDLSAGADVPDVTEGESRDIALMAAVKLAPGIDRSDLVPGLIADVSAKTRATFDAKFRALLEPRRRETEVTT